MHGPEPAHAKQLGDAAGVLTISLDHHGRECRLDLPGLQEDGLKPGSDQVGMEPLRQGTGFKADAGEWQVEPGQESDQRFRLAGHLCLADDPTRGVHHAHAAQVSTQMFFFFVSEPWNPGSLANALTLAWPS